MTDRFDRRTHITGPLPATPVWDTHIHLFPERLFRAIWRWFARAGWDIPYAQRDLKYYLSFLQEMGVETGFLLPYCHKPGMAMDLNRWVARVCRDNTWLVPFAGIHPQDENIPEILANCLDTWGFAGVKLQLAVLKYPADHPCLLPVYQALWERNKILVIHAGTAPYGPGQEEYAALGLDSLHWILMRFPGLKTVIPHFGLYELDLCAFLVSTYPNVYVDTSWTLGNPHLRAWLPRLHEFMHRHTDKILYGSDFPILEHSPVAGIQDVLGLDVSEAKREMILRNNARSLLASVVE